MKEKLAAIIFLTAFLSGGSLWARNSGFSVGVQTGAGEQYANAEKSLSRHFGTELRYAFNSTIIAHFEFDWAATQEATNFGPIGGLAFNIPFGGGHSIQLGAGLDAIYAAVLGVLIAALADDDGSGSDSLSRDFTHHDFGGSRRLYFQSSYRYRFAENLAGFVKGRYMYRDADAGRYQSAGALFVGAEFFLF